MVATCMQRPLGALHNKHASTPQMGGLRQKACHGLQNMPAGWRPVLGKAAEDSQPRARGKRRKGKAPEHEQNSQCWQEKWRRSDMARTGGCRDGVLPQRVLQAGRQLQRRLPAELHDDAVRALRVQHVEHVLDRQRLEVQARRGVVVRGHRFRVAVHHYRLVPRAPARARRTPLPHGKPFMHRESQRHSASTAHCVDPFQTSPQQLLHLRQDQLTAGLLQRHWQNHTPLFVHRAAEQPGRCQPHE